eukprot:2961909-Pyramimonas_sp.AAC.1
MSYSAAPSSLCLALAPSLRRRCIVLGLRGGRTRHGRVGSGVDQHRHRPESPSFFPMLFSVTASRAAQPHFDTIPIRNIMFGSFVPNQ